MSELNGMWSDFSFRPTPTYHTKYWNEYSFKITLGNKSDFPVDFDVWIQFLDKDEFEVERTVTTFKLQANTEQVVTSRTLVNYPAAKEFTQVVVYEVTLSRAK